MSNMASMSKSFRPLHRVLVSAGNAGARNVRASPTLVKWGSGGYPSCFSSVMTRSFATAATPASSDGSKAPSLRDLPPEHVNDLLNSATIAELVTQACETFADKPSLGTRVGDKYEWITYRQLAERIQRLRNVLVHHKIGVNSKVSLISNNREEWAVAMYAVASLGAQLVPM
jgi:hypothetical protein